MVEKNKIFHNNLEQPFILCFLLFGVTAFASIPAGSTASTASTSSATVLSNRAHHPERLRRPYYQG